MNLANGTLDHFNGLVQIIDMFEQLDKVSNFTVIKDSAYFVVNIFDFMEGDLPP